MSKIAEIVTFLRTNTKVPNNSVFIFAGLLLDGKTYSETNNIYDFLSSNLQHIQELNVVEIDKFFVENNMYKQTYYSRINKKNNNLNTQSNTDLNTQLNADLNTQLTTEANAELNADSNPESNAELNPVLTNDLTEIIITDKLYALDHELNTNFEITNINNFTEETRVGWSGVCNNIEYYPNFKANTYYFYLRNQDNGSLEKGIVFSY